jgi:serine/threonine protein kinase/dienelactone hydrolase
MTPERWQRIEELYHSARERGPAVLEGSDPALRREVERLLAQDSQGQILDRSPAQILREVATDPAAVLAGQTVSHYKVLERLGTGGMGVVYKAFDTNLDRLVALKFLAPHLSHDDELKQRLREEARAASALDHPNIVVIHDIGEAPEGDLFIAMAFHEGVTLREKLALEKPSLKEALQIARQIASGLARAHEHGIVHRDIKPGNIIIAKDGVARIIDFGLAKSIDVTATIDGSVRGTPLYMSPEQATGGAVDCRTDLWSLGAVLYEMIAGAPPFRGDTQVRVIHAVVNEHPPHLRDIRPELPTAVDEIVSRALEKDPAMRHQSAADLGNDLAAALQAIESPPKHVGLWARYAIAAAALVLLAAALSIWLVQRSEKRHWAREQAIPEIARLKDQNRPLAAFQLLQKAQKYLPGDSQLTQIAEGLTNVVTVNSTPPGALVEIKDYVSPNEQWFALGTTPLNKITIPPGYYRWHVSKVGVGELLGAPVVADIHGYFHEFRFDLNVAASAPKGMIAIPATHYEEYVWSIPPLGPYDLPVYYMDRFEVTNREYQEFVDRGGYQKPEYWKQKFVRDGRTLTWDEAINLMRDQTGRPGPATWQAGHYPVGQADSPVNGVSWYEAASYAQFVGKSLPTVAQWYLSAPAYAAKYVIPLSNFSGSGPVPGGKYDGLGAFGAYDVAGNVAEWCWNEGGNGGRYLLGGAWNTSSAEYFEPVVVPPFTRGAGDGIRCARNAGSLPSTAMAYVPSTERDLSKSRPATNTAFQIYKTMYAYDRRPLNAKPEPVRQDSADWRKEKVTIDAAYGNERMALYLFLPAKVRPPYQLVAFFPSARVLDISNSEKLGDMKFIDYLIQSGRAVVYPVYKGTYERPAAIADVATIAGRETMIQQSKDLGRSLDYLETRPDIDRNRFGYIGVSMGAAQGVAYTALEERFKAVVFLDGGFYDERPLPGTDQVDFAPRLKAPVLMVSGKFDYVLGAKETILQLFGTPPADKKSVMFDTSHDVSEQHADMVREVLAWFDKYLGKIQ